ncbi:FecR family protein [Marinomonas sp. M1K-6]|uniref:FecR family protein n=1 Tax=Marinomonas profundi TaxID=2726122 RepID=A0A847R934_9GAMM|nr:FecR family protein [Marinomonas profundi]NLQ17454.1 FecR family protein [Marinomonas profundi]UDV01977.1 FecR family protein [Marinomonas profundi]
MNKANTPIAKHSLEDAADWLIRLQEAPLTREEKAQLEQWQKAHADNAHAWARVQRLMQQVDTLPKGAAAAVLNRPDDESRRFAIGKLALLLAAGPALWGTYKTLETQQWSADYRTAKGEFQHITLPDGSLVTLNTATAFDMTFNRHSRLLSLREGEIEIHTAQVDPQHFGPFIIHTQEGTLTPLGKRLSVRQCDGFTQLAALEGQVQVTPKRAQQDAVIKIPSGYQAKVSPYELLSSEAISPATTAWLKQMLAVHDMPLKQFAQEVSRYRLGYLRVSPDIENLMVSGAFPTTDTDTILNMLSHTYPIHAKQHLGGYWVTLEPA